MAITQKSIRQRQAKSDALKYQIDLLKACEPLLSFSGQHTEEDYTHYAKRFGVKAEDLKNRFLTL